MAIREREFELKIKDFGSGLPIDMNSLSTPQLMQLAARLRTEINAGAGRAVESANNLSSSPPSDGTKSTRLASRPNVNVTNAGGLN